MHNRNEDPECKNCEGTGEVDDKDCVVCGGFGELLTCPCCGGDGIDYDMQCDVCYGIGCLRMSRISSRDFPWKLYSP